jgi:hypothetical protein
MRYLNGEDGWASIIRDTAGQIWLEHYVAESPGRDYDRALARFREAVGEALSRTSRPTGDVTQAQIGRIVRWLSTYSVNAGTISGAYGRGIRFKRWTTMNDADVREIHEHLDGQIRPIGGTFDVAGHRLPYPAVPVGPPEVWIECRCVAQPASREGETMSANTFTIGPEYEIDEEHEIVSNNITAAGDLANPDGTPYTGALVVLVPADSDPVVAASSEPAHVTTVWFGELADLPVDVEELEQAVRLYAQDLDGPVVVPVRERGTLGDDDADVVFLEPTDSLLALRDGLLVNEPIKTAYDAAEQFPEWTPHVTLGYPDRPAKAEYDATEVTFDRISLWLGGEHYDYPMGGAAVTADAAIADEDVVDEDIPLDEPEDDEDLITEIPIHGVLAPEGILTGDGRGFREGALSTRPLPVPFRYEYVSSHGGNQTSEVATVGRIDQAWKHEESGMWRFLGAIVLDKPYASAAISSIIDGTGSGVSIDADDMVQDFSDILDEEGNYIEKPFDLAEVGKQEEMWFSQARVAGLTQVPIPAFHEAYVALGHEFAEDMTEEQVLAASAALEDCGCDGEVALTAAGVDFRDVSPKERKRLADEGNAMPDGSYPIANEEDLRNAIQAIGRAKDPDAVKAHIKKRARALGKEDLIPEGWSLARGGFVTAGTFALAGETGTPEYIVPLTAVGDNQELLARIAQGEASFAPGTKDGPGWITHPVATSRIRRYWVRGTGAGKIGWGRGGDFYRCRNQLRKYVANPDWLDGLCANMHKEATGIWPGQHDAHSIRQGLVAAGTITAEPAPLARLVASASRKFPAAAFAEPEDLGRAYAMRIDRETRRIWGFAADWTTCHIGITGMCQEPPKSHSNYSYFRKGLVETDAGEQSVGLLTMGIGHAGERVSAAAATAHYDRTEAVKAYINIGENAYGIWYAGVLAPWVTDDDIDAMLAIRRVSGDWRNWSGRYGDLEMVGLVVVNTEGFQLAASGALDGMVEGVQTAAIGIGSVDVKDDEPVTSKDVGETHEQFVQRLAVEVARVTAFKAREQAARERIHALRVADARARLERI